MPALRPLALEDPAMKRWVTDLWRREEGTTSLEWVFVASVLVLGSAAGLLAIRRALSAG
jgi:hypothetical protein